MKRFFAVILLMTLLMSACAAEAASAHVKASDLRDKTLLEMEEDGSLDELFARPTRIPQPSPEPDSQETLVLVEENLRIDDEKGLFTPQEEEELAQYMRPIAAHGCVMVWTTYDAWGSVDEKALAYFKRHSRDFKTDDGLLLMFDIKKRQVYLLSRGGMEAYVNRSDAYAITADVSHFATKEEYAKCAMEALDRVTILIEEGRLQSPMRVICSILLGLAMGLIVAYLLARRQSMQPMPGLEERTSTSGMNCTGELTNRYTRHMGERYTIFAIVVIGIVRLLAFAAEVSSSSDSYSGSGRSQSRSVSRGSFRSSGGSSRRDSGGSGGGSSF